MMSFITTLFEHGEMICTSNLVYGTNVDQLNEGLELQSYISINPLKESRNDVNCTALRNILIEFDNLSLNDQMELVKKLGMPYSSCVFSGKKSYHFIISVTPDFKNRHEYDRIVRWIYEALPGVDRSNKNPSRFSRAPGVMRKDTGKEQSLIELKSRIKQDDVIEWLKLTGVKEPKIYEAPAVTKFRRVKMPLLLTARTREFMQNGAADGKKNTELFVASCNLYRAGFDEAEIIAIGKRVLDFENHPRCYRTVKSAIKTCNRQGC